MGQSGLHAVSALADCTINDIALVSTEIAVLFSIGMVDEYQPEPVLDAFARKEYESVMRMAWPYARAGNPDAQCMVALLYEHGFGVERDVLEAERWLLKATEQNSRLAWHNLGTIYVMQYPELAHRWTDAYGCWVKAKQLGFNCGEPYPPPCRPE